MPKQTIPPRCIRKYNRVAQKDHSCWMCPDPINPGQEYIGEVYVGKADGRKYFHVYKHHETCPGRRYDEEEEDGREEDESYVDNLDLSMEEEQEAA